MSDQIVRNDQVMVTHILKHRLAPRPQPNGRFWSPLQRVPAGWVGRYLSSIWSAEVYDATSDTVSKHAIHLVEAPSGKLCNVLLDDIRPDSESGEELEHCEPGDLVAVCCDLQHRYDATRSIIPHGTAGIVLDAPRGGRYVRVDMSPEEDPRWLSRGSLRIVEKGFLQFTPANPSSAIELLWDTAAEQGAALASAGQENARLHSELSNLLKYKTGADLAARASDGS